ncbi:MAG: phosphomethylpyrimidine synthase ThiC [Candidatus Omnitrophica bacterium]|nr:phosphomethylpyrimidine synthase ThiC [Candidatus Omnitrophota bacterium]
MNILDVAQKGKGNNLIKKICCDENFPQKQLMKDIVNGFTVIPININRDLSKPCAIGKGLKTKVNVNIGVSPDSSNLKQELKKLKLSVELGADAVMDLSVGKDIRKIRQKILRNCQVPLGTVPMYEIAVKRDNKIGDITEKDFFQVLIDQAKEGVDFFTIHSGVTKQTVSVMQRSKRLIKMVSRGGAMISKWITLHKKENPFYKRFDEVLDIAKQYDVTLSLGDGMRPGSLADATDNAQISELKVLGKLQKLALKKGVQTMIEGPGHVPIDQIKKNMELEKKYCNGAPFYVLGPLVTDIAPGYDHITSAIGGAIAATYGADFLCYVTPAEHLCLPDINDVRDGLIASKIAAHAADIAKGVKGAINRDIDISKARNARDWKKQFSFALDPEKAFNYRKNSMPSKKDVCSMCGEFCPIKILEK